jgi:PKD repeat protein
MVTGFLMIARSSAVPTRRRRPLPFDVLLAITVLLLALVVSGCDTAPLLAPTQSTMSLVAAAQRAPLNSEVEILATVQENSGTPVQNGTLVTFTTTLGTLQPRQATTVGGTARTILQTGTVSGTATINATSGNARTSGGGTAGSGTTTTTTPGTNVQILIGAAAANRISVVARPGAVSSSGGTAEIIAAVVDDAGNPVTSVPVNFSTDQGTLSASSVTTDRNGEARTTLSTNRESIVTARVGAGGTDRTATVTVRVNTAPTLTIGTVTPANPTVAQSISFTVTPAANTTLDVTVDFGDGTSQNLGRINAQQTVTHTYTSAGTFTIRITGRDSNTGESIAATTAVTVGNRQPLSVTLTATAGTAVPHQGQPFTFTANVTPATGGADQVESYSWNFGDGSSTVTTSGNSTTHVYQSNGPRTVTVTVRTLDGRTASAQTEIIANGI